MEKGEEMKVKKYLLQSICGFILWTGGLTPYMLFVVRVNMTQYLKWVSMQIIIVPLFSILAVNLTNKIVRKILGE